MPPIILKEKQEPLQQRFANLLCAYLVLLVNEPEKVSVKPEGGDLTFTLKIECSPTDVGLIIGRDGNQIRAMRTMFHAIGRKRRRQVRIDVPGFGSG